VYKDKIKKLRRTHIEGVGGHKCSLAVRSAPDKREIKTRWPKEKIAKNNRKEIHPNGQSNKKGMLQ
jgi:hypothetical protein